MRLAHACAVLAALAPAAVAVAQDAPPALAATYVCDGGAVLQVAYLNPAAGPSLAVVAWAGRLIPMQAGPTGSGVRYVAFDGQPRFVWHAKGRGGVLLSQADEAADAEVALGGCAEAGADGE